MGKSRHRAPNSSAAACGGGTVILSSFPSPSPSSSSSSSSDFEFTVSLSPSSRCSAAQQCPADELFYKGKLLPLHLSPRISMVRTLLLASSSTSSSSDATTTASRDSTGSSSSSDASSFSPADLLLLHPDCDSSRPSSVTEDEVKRARRPNYFSSFATRFSSVFHLKKEATDIAPPPVAKKTTKQMIKKYVKKMKPIYEKLSSLQQKQPQLQPPKKTFSFSIKRDRSPSPVKKEYLFSDSHTHSFSGNLRYPRRNRCAGSCPSSMRSSPTHSGLLYVKPKDTSSSMEELQSAIQGAIAHCKNTMSQAKIK